MELSEYLPELQLRQKWWCVSRNFVPGDIVLLVDETAPRNSWVIGKVIQSVPDEHRLVRRVRVKIKTNELERPIAKVCLLLEAVWGSGKDSSPTVCQILVPSDIGGKKTVLKIVLKFVLRLFCFFYSLTLI